ncbi:MAG: response regulator [Rickettsiales bacterium]|nr:response regulator [Rickettsiales bacterium]
MPEIADYLKHIDILIADPDERIRSLVRDVLVNSGFTNVIQTNNGKEAITRLREQNIDLLITDWRMAPVNGMQLIDYLRADKSSPNPYLPIIMLTGRAERKDVSAARDIGVTEFLVKPFTAKALYERLVMVIENPRSFIISNDYHGPDRRRRTDIPPTGIDRRKNPPINGGG